MGKIAFVFAGQGAQYSGMGQSLCEMSPAARAVFDVADKLRPGTSQQCFTAPVEELSITENTQPCLYCVDLAAAKALEEAGVRADVAAGFSLGEIAALSFAGVFTPEQGFDFVCKRGRAMQKAGRGISSAQDSFLTRFPDGAAVSAAARPAVAAMAQAGVIKGDQAGNLNPTGTLTRAEMAVILHRALTL